LCKYHCNMACIRALTSVHEFPVVEHTLGECLPSCLRAEITVKAEGLHDGEVSLDCEHRRSRPLLFAEDLATTPVQHTVDTTDGILRTLNLDCEENQYSVGCRREIRSHLGTQALGDQG